MEPIVGFGEGVVDAILGLFNGVFDPNEVYLIPIVIAIIGVLAFGLLSNKIGAIWPAWVFAAFAVSFLILFINGTGIDSILAGIVVLLVGSLVLAISHLTGKERDIKFGLIYSVATVALFFGVLGASAANQEAGVIPYAVMQFKSTAEAWIATLQG